MSFSKRRSVHLNFFDNFFELASLCFLYTSYFRQARVILIKSVFILTIISCRNHQFTLEWAIHENIKNDLKLSETRTHPVLVNTQEGYLLRIETSLDTDSVVIKIPKRLDF